MKTAEFKITPIKGVSPIIIDYCCYKITILMYNGVTVKFFKEHNGRWYKLKDTKWDYFQIDNCIAWAKSAIDNNYAWFQDKLSKEVEQKSKN